MKYYLRLVGITIALPFQLLLIVCFGLFFGVKKYIEHFEAIRKEQKDANT